MPETTTEAIARRIGEAAPIDGVHETAVPYMHFIRCSRPTRLERGVLQPSLCLIAQGRKKLHLGGEVIHYGSGNYILAVLDIPISGQILDASEAEPYLGLRIDLNPKEVASVILEARLNVPDEGRPNPAAHVGGADVRLLETMLRLVHLAREGEVSPYLADIAKKEIVYRLLCTESGPLLCQNALPGRNGHAVGQAIRRIKEDYASPLRMEDLAREANMAVSTFHRKFKAATTMSPLQYQKQIRLMEARRLLLVEGADAASAAFAVGYESPSQFSREYHRLFGAPPLRDMERVGREREPVAGQD